MVWSEEGNRCEGVPVRVVAQAQLTRTIAATAEHRVILGQDHGVIASCHDLLGHLAVRERCHQLECCHIALVGPRHEQVIDEPSFAASEQRPVRGQHNRVFFARGNLLYLLSLLSSQYKG